MMKPTFIIIVWISVGEYLLYTDFFFLLAFNHTRILIEVVYLRFVVAFVLF